MLALIQLEQSIVVMANQLANSSVFLVAATRAFATGAIFIIVGFFILSFFINWDFIRVTGKLIFMEGLIAGSLAWIFNQIVGLIYFRERPYVVIDTLKVLINDTMLSKSFPSDHTTIAFALSATVFLWSPKVGIWFLVLAALIALARVFGGVHYPTDIIGGIIVGIFFAWFIHKLFV